MEQDSDKKVRISSGERTWLIRIREIIIVKATEQGTIIKQASGAVLSSTQTVDQLLLKLTPHGFLHIHEDCIVNPGFIDKVTTGKDTIIFLKSGEMLPVGEKWKENILNYLENMNSIDIF